MRVAILPGCIGCGLCVNTCPHVFQFGPEETAQVAQSPRPQDEDPVRDAASQCPVGVIKVEEAPQA